MKNIIILGLCMFLLVISSCSQQNNYVIEEDSVHWENAYGKINVTPHTCNTEHCSYEADIEIYLPSQDFDFAFRFDEPLTNAHLFEWSGTLNPYIIFNNETQQNETLYRGGWIDRTQAFSRTDHEEKVYYWVSGVGFIQNELKKYRWEFDNPGGDGKWELLAKRTSETLQSAIENENYIMLDPWYTTPTLSTNVTHYYDFDTDGSFLDLVGSLNGSSQGSPTFKSGDGICNGAYDFGDTNSYFNFTEDLVDESADFSISTWVYFPIGTLPINAYGYMYSQRESTGSYGIGMGIYNSTIIFIAHENVKTLMGTVNTMSENNWYHVVYIYDLGGTPQNSIYVNNVKASFDAAENSSTIAEGIGNAIAIGTRGDGTTGNFTGYIDETAFWNKSLTTSEINELYNSGYGVCSDVGIQILNISLTPTTAYTNSTLNCSGFVNDTLLGSDLNVNITSYKNSVVYDIATLSNIASSSYIWNTSIFPSSLVSGDQWYCSIYAEERTNSSRNDTSSSSIRTITSLTPSIPTTISPANLSVYFAAPVLTCSGSVDPEGDTINYTFAESDNTSLQNSQLTTYTWTGLSSGTEDDWKCRACDNNSQCSDYTGLRNISRMKLEQCTPSGEGLVLNFTSWDETNTSWNLTANWDASLTMSSVIGSNLSNFELDNNHTFSVCLTPKGSDVTLDGMIEYVPTNASLYSYARQYYFVDDIRNGDNTSHVKVYSLLDTLATAVTFHVTEGGTTPLEDASLLLERYYPGTGVYDLVAMGETSNLGRDIIYLQLTDAWYRVTCYDSSNVLRYTSSAEHITATDYYINLAGEPGEYNETERWYAYDDINWSLSFDNTTNLTTLTWNDDTGYLDKMCFRLSKYSMSGTGYEALATSCVSAVSGSLNYTITTSGFYIAKAIAYHSGDWRLLGSLEIDLVEELEELIGLDGVLFSILLIGTMAFLGLYSPTMAIVFTQISLVMVKAFGLLNISWGAIIGIIFIGFILLFKQKGR